MANGIQPYILEGITTVFKEANPYNKRDANGFLASLLSSENVSPLLTMAQTGATRREVRIKYVPRNQSLTTSTTIDCTEATCDYYNEFTAEITGQRMASFCIEADQLALLLNEEAVDFARLRDNPTMGLPVRGADAARQLRILGSQLANTMDSLRKAIDIDLVTAQALNFGINEFTGLNANIPLDFLDASGNKIPLGLNRLMTDLSVHNRFMGQPFIIGAGNFAAFNNLMMTTAGFPLINDAATNYTAMASAFGYMFMLDQNTDTLLGANQLIVYEPGAIQLAMYNDFAGAFTGKIGNDENFTINDPLYPNLIWDIKVNDKDCASGGNWRGKITVYVSAHYELIHMPADIYDAADVLFGNNGTYRYSATIAP